MDGLLASRFDFVKLLKIFGIRYASEFPEKIPKNSCLNDPPLQLSKYEDDFWVAQAPRAQQLLDSPPYSAVIVATNGDMARMHTLHPQTFIRFKQWMSTLPEREPIKRRRDALQAMAVEEVLRDYLPHLVGA